MQDLQTLMSPRPCNPLVVLLLGVLFTLGDFLIFFGIPFSISFGFVGCVLVTVYGIALTSDFASCCRIRRS